MVSVQMIKKHKMARLLPNGLAITTNTSQKVSALGRRFLVSLLLPAPAAHSLTWAHSQVFISPHPAALQYVFQAIQQVGREAPRQSSYWLSRPDTPVGLCPIQERAGWHSKGSHLTLSLSVFFPYPSISLCHCSPGTVYMTC